MPKVAKFGLFPSVRFNILNVGASGSGKSTFIYDLLSPYATQVERYNDGFRAKGDDFTIDSKWIMESATCKAIITVYDAPQFGDADNRLSLEQLSVNLADRHDAWTSMNNSEQTEDERNGQDKRMHLVFAFLGTGSLSKLMQQILELLSKKANVVLVVPKADCLNPQERVQYLRNIQDSVEGLSLYVFKPVVTAPAAPAVPAAAKGTAAKAETLAGEASEVEEIDRNEMSYINIDDMDNSSPNSKSSSHVGQLASDSMSSGDTTVDSFEIPYSQYPYDSSALDFSSGGEPRLLYFTISCGNESGTRYGLGGAVVDTLDPEVSDMSRLQCNLFEGKAVAELNCSTQLLSIAQYVKRRDEGAAAVLGAVLERFAASLSAVCKLFLAWVSLVLGQCLVEWQTMKKIKITTIPVTTATNIWCVGTCVAFLLLLASKQYYDGGSGGVRGGGNGLMDGQSIPASTAPADTGWFFTTRRHNESNYIASAAAGAAAAAAAGAAAAADSAASTDASFLEKVCAWGSEAGGALSNLGGDARDWAWGTAAAKLPVSSWSLFGAKAATSSAQKKDKEPSKDRDKEEVAKAKEKSQEREKEKEQAVAEETTKRSLPLRILHVGAAKKL